MADEIFDITIKQLKMLSEESERYQHHPEALVDITKAMAELITAMNVRTYPSAKKCSYGYMASITGQGDNYGR